jgi:Tol biopolymer transport system component
MAKERKPDLNDSGDASVEERVREMMEPEPPKPAVTSDKKDGPVSAPELPKNTVSIKVVDHDETEGGEPAEAAEDPDLAAAIEEANKKLLEATEVKPADDDEDTEPVPEPEEEGEEEPEDLQSSDKQEEPATAPELEDETPEEAPAPAENEETEPESDNPDDNDPSDKTDDPETDKAVDEIVAEEGDALLAAEDERRELDAWEPKPTPGERLKSFLAFFWKNRVARTTLILLLLAGVAAAAIVPASRYYLLNMAGVRSSASVRVFDQSTRQPLKNVNITIAGRTSQTDIDGYAQLDGLKLGATELSIEKRAFAAQTKRMVVGWGSNPLGDYSLTPTGTQYTFVLSDYFSGKPVVKAEAISGDASALSDEEGLLKLTIDKEVSKTLNELEVSITAHGYREEQLVFDADQTEDKELRLVAARKHIFVSKRSGRYDVYKIDADGKNESLLFSGTGSEREDMVLAPHPEEELLALVSTRENKRNRDGFLLSTLTFIDISSGEAKGLALSERIQVVGWSGNRLIYVQVASGSSAVNPKRHQLISYDYEQQRSTELAASNYFNDVMLAGGKLFYAPSSAYSGGASSHLFRVDPDGRNRQVVLEQEVWSLFRTAPDKIVMALQQRWYEHDLKSAATQRLEGEPANLSSRVYAASPDGKRYLWVDTRDGKGVLLLARDGQEDQVVHSEGGLRNPVRWLNDTTAVFRIHTGQETADYVISTAGGKPMKLRDVTNTGGVDRWYYY